MSYLTPKTRVRRFAPILGPFVGVLLCFWFISLITKDIPTSHARGERLSFAALAAGEEIVVSKFIGHRTVIAREYRIGKNGDPRHFTAFDLSSSRTEASPAAELVKILATRSLTDAERKGLDETVAYFRRRWEERSSATRHYRLVYFRDGEKIGEEFFVGFSLPDDLPDLLKNETGRTFDEREHGISRAQIDRLVTFEMLEKP